MGRLEDLVPPLELCREIPKRQFADSALVWTYSYIKSCYHVQMRENRGTPHFPAPTLAEIMAELRTKGAVTSTLNDSGCIAQVMLRRGGIKVLSVDTGCVDSMINLWLELNDKGKKGKEG